MNTYTKLSVKAAKNNIKTTIKVEDEHIYTRRKLELDVTRISQKWRSTSS